MQCTYNSTCSSVGAFPHTIKSGHLACSSVYDVIQRTCPTIWRKQLPSAEWCHPIRYDTISLRDSDGNIASFCPLVACLRRICFSSIQWIRDTPCDTDIRNTAGKAGIPDAVGITAAARLHAARHRRRHHCSDGSRRRHSAQRRRRRPDRGRRAPGHRSVPPSKAAPGRWTTKAAMSSGSAESSSQYTIVGADRRCLPPPSW